MKTFEFTLKFSIQGDKTNTDSIVEKLAEAGCNDALIGLGQSGRIALNFDREAKTALAAVSSAITDVKSAIPSARLIEATPDLVGLSDLADLAQCSRQNMRKIMLNSGQNFPAPLHEGKVSLWHLSNVLIWLRDEKHYIFDDALLEVAKITMQLNIAREARAMDASLQHRIQRLMS
ncbi:DNA-binding protein [Spongiibacter sp. KMU-158]|uniref:DNA-binding protein n=1 Tax=Spongiibacter pelagi TaxID=2760804 RepID=A0A927C2N3_9GAMM|nr:DNA-binding protein [Spongiibacter pelagi]MBD2858907.1 DNA-binding protein [Spongiibacter pelagi]